jgi:hypothetical protein
MTPSSIFRQLIVLLAFFVIIAIPFSCKKDEVKTEQLEPPKIENTDSVQVIVSGDTPEFRTRVYILDEETSSQIVSVTRNKIVIKKGAILRGGRTGGIAATEVKSGEIMAAGKTSKTPEASTARLQVYVSRKTERRSRLIQRMPHWKTSLKTHLSQSKNRSNMAPAWITRLAGRQERTAQVRGRN